MKDDIKWLVKHDNCVDMMINHNEFIEDKSFANEWRDEWFRFAGSARCRYIITPTKNEMMANCDANSQYSSQQNHNSQRADMSSMHPKTLIEDESDSNDKNTDPGSDKPGKQS